MTRLSHPRPGRPPLVALPKSDAYGKPVRDYLAAHRRVVVEPFPPYAPELNPVDYVWSYVKYDRLPNYCPSGLSELRQRITAEFRRLQKRPDLLESLFQRAGLPLDPQIVAS